MNDNKQGEKVKKLDLTIYVNDKIEYLNSQKKTLRKKLLYSVLLESSDLYHNAFVNKKYDADDIVPTIVAIAHHAIFACKNLSKIKNKKFKHLKAKSFIINEVKDTSLLLLIKKCNKYVLSNGKKEILFDILNICYSYCLKHKIDFKARLYRYTNDSY